VDWRRWKAESDRSSSPGSSEDDDWHDEDFALTKKASFPLEQWSTQEVTQYSVKFREHSVNFREHSVNFQGTYIQASFPLEPVEH
jgi:3'-phosphoadenosine 5'-phosphosulfate sulfotransferase (PAPS reductase)/FAD synthetase